MLDRRSFLAMTTAGAAAAAAATTGCTTATTPTTPPGAPGVPSPSPPSPPPHPHADLEEATIADLAARMQRGEISALDLVERYTARIEAIDRAGPSLRAVIELNPDAPAIAAKLDEERRTRGPRGPLHGIPLLLKDNIDTGDRMLTTAGSLALAGSPAPADARIVARLREAGAVLLGKTNLSEWANIRSTRPTSGWSARGGLTRNPYALDRNTSGSSSGSAAAVAANLCAAAIGTETDGSIVSPASICGIVGLKPTVGLVSRAGIIPIAHSQDTAGPMTRTVADAAILLGVLAGVDPRDAATARQPARGADARCQRGRCTACRSASRSSRAPTPSRRCCAWPTRTSKRRGAGASRGSRRRSTPAAAPRRACAHPRSDARAGEPCQPMRQRTQEQGHGFSLDSRAWRERRRAR